MAQVKFKYGTMAQYNAITTKDNDTLYFITDRKMVYKGDDEYTSNIKSVVISTTGSGEAELKKLTITLADGSTVVYEAPSSTALSEVKKTLEGKITNHSGQKATTSTFSHVKLSNDFLTATAEAGKVVGDGSDGIAATPLAVKTALEQAKTYTDNSFAANDAMLFKGTIGTGGTVTTLPTSGYKKGWTYRVITKGTYATHNCEIGDLIIAIEDGPETQQSARDTDWTVAQTNIDGAVVANGDLTAEGLVLGNGNKTVKVLSKGTSGQILKSTGSGVEWADNKVANTLTVKLNSGTDEGSTMFTFDGSNAKSVNITPAAIGASASEHKHAASDITSGTLPVSRGGTGATTFTSGYALIGNGTSAVTTKKIDTTVTSGSSSLITSGAVDTAINGVQKDFEAAMSWSELTSTAE